MFQLSTHSPDPLYRQIVDQVRRCVVGGQWVAGFELPSVRQVAADHAINPMTVSKAYSLLELEGLLTRKRGMGMVVADTVNTNVSNSHSDQLTQSRLALIRPSVQALVQSAAQLNLSPEQLHRLLDESIAAATKP